MVYFVKTDVYGTSFPRYNMLVTKETAVTEVKVMWTIIICILLLVAMFKLTGFFLKICGKLIGAIFSLIGYVIIAAIAGVGIAIIAIPIILVIGVCTVGVSAAAV